MTTISDMHVSSNLVGSYVRLISEGVEALRSHPRIYKFASMVDGHPKDKRPRVYWCEVVVVRVKKRCPNGIESPTLTLTVVDQHGRFVDVEPCFVEVKLITRNGPAGSR